MQSKVCHPTYTFLASEMSYTVLQQPLKGRVLHIPLTPDFHEGHYWKHCSIFLFYFQVWPTLYILACLCKRHLKLSLQLSHLQCRRGWWIQDFTSTGTWMNSALFRTPCLQGRTVLQSIFTSVQQLGSNRRCYCSHNIAVFLSLQVFQHQW